MQFPLVAMFRKLLMTVGLQTLLLSTVSAAVLEEVVVTAQKRESSLQDTPIAISAYNESALDSIGTTEFSSISDYTPNVVIAPMPGQNGTVISIRGIGTGDPSSAIDPKVGLYIDGVYVARSTGNLFELDLERIEVLRGPQGTLWGKNTTGGSINVTTAKPGGQLGLEQDIGIGKFGYRYARTRLDSPTMDMGGAGQLSGRLTYLAKRYDGWADRVNSLVAGPEDLGEIDSEYVRLALRGELSNSISLDYSYEDYNRRGTARQDQMLHAIPGLGVAEFTEPSRRLEKFQLDSAGADRLSGKSHTLTATWEIDEDLVVKSITGKRESDTFFQPDLDGTPAQFTSVLLSSLAPHTGGIYDFLGTRDHEQFSQEFQVVGSALAGRVEYTGGLYYFTEKGGENSTAILYLASFDAFTDLSKVYTVENESRAVYGQLSYTPDVLDSRLRLTLGGRYSEDVKQANKTVHNGLATALHGERDWDNISMAGVAEYRLGESVNTYVRIAEGYNAGIFNIRSSQTSTFSTPAAEETLTSYELGLKSELVDRRLRLNFAAFLSDYRDMQQLLFVGGDSTAVNVGDAELSGIELEALVILGEYFTVGANYAHLDYDIKEFINNDTDVSDQATLPFSADKSASAFVEFTAPIHGFGTLSARLDTVHKGRVAFAPLNFESSEADSYTLYNARMELSDMHAGNFEFSLALWGRNLTNEEHRIFGVDFGEFQTGTFGDPRAFGVDITLLLQ
ncbi:TonB-dependent receptor [Parahaliea mediterranea]|uniref:TonB-dependent receptor n=1 Tax=Parahaliea mediterranea TaxID=651086 RepID=A0A939DF37_9GAMM|nr:TonB-dependent receptor [Parahaliea mediterranea]MBN7796899.1 TonB-dependent receptor [Parahaliea mediterranea]